MEEAAEEILAAKVDGDLSYIGWSTTPSTFLDDMSFPYTRKKCPRTREAEVRQRLEVLYFMGGRIWKALTCSPHPARIRSHARLPCGSPLVHRVICSPSPSAFHGGARSPSCEIRPSYTYSGLYRRISRYCLPPPHQWTNDSFASGSQNGRWNHRRTTEAENRANRPH